VERAKNDRKVRPQSRVSTGRERSRPPGGEKEEGLNRILRPGPSAAEEKGSKNADPSTTWTTESERLSLWLRDVKRDFRGTQHKAV